MIADLVALLMLVAGVAGTIVMFRDLRAGHARFLFSGGVHWLECSFRENAYQFWLITLVNVALIGVALGVGGLLVVGLLGE